jgi:hypothetical protein
VIALSKGVRGSPKTIAEHQESSPEDECPLGVQQLERAELLLQDASRAAYQQS